MLDETGGDTMDHGTEDSVGSDEISVSYGGGMHTDEADLDLNHDGFDESATVDTADGSNVIVSDTDGDGMADTAFGVSNDGTLSADAQFDPATGEWVSADATSAAPADSGGASPAGGGAEVSADSSTETHENPDGSTTTTTTTTTSVTDGPDTMTADVGGQQVDVGVADTDTDGDGVNDTVVGEVGGSTVSYTDTDGDGVADTSMTIGADGGAAMSEYDAADGSWTVTESAEGDPAGDAQWGGGQAHAEASASATVDPATGQA